MIKKYPKNISISKGYLQIYKNDNGLINKENIEWDKNKNNILNININKNGEIKKYKMNLSKKNIINNDILNVPVISGDLKYRLINDITTPLMYSQNINSPIIKKVKSRKVKSRKVKSKKVKSKKVKSKKVKSKKGKK